MKTDSTYTTPTDQPMAPEEIEAHVDKHWEDLDRVSVCRKLGHSVRKITTIHMEDEDQTKKTDLIELIMDIVGGCMESEGVNTFRINCYNKSGDGKLRQHKVDFELETLSVEAKDVPKLEELLLAQSNVQWQQNRLLTKEIIAMATNITKMQAEIIEHLAGKYVEGLGHQENALRIQYDSEREERQSQIYASALERLATTVEGVLPIIGGKAAGGLKAIGGNVATIVEAWKSIVESLTPDQATKISNECDPEVAGRIHDLIGKTKAEDEKEICTNISALMEQPAKLAPLQGILSLQQAAALQTLWVRIREHADAS